MYKRSSCIYICKCVRNCVFSYRINIYIFAMEKYRNENYDKTANE